MAVYRPQDALRSLLVMYLAGFTSINKWVEERNREDITDRLTVGNSELVIGQRDDAPGNFVTWKCRKGEKDYFWGHYLNDRLSDVEDLYRCAQSFLFLRLRSCCTAICWTYRAAAITAPYYQSNN